MDALLAGPESLRGESPLDLVGLDLSDVDFAAAALPDVDFDDAEDDPPVLFEGVFLLELEADFFAPALLVVEPADAFLPEDLPDDDAASEVDVLVDADLPEEPDPLDPVDLADLVDLARLPDVLDGVDLRDLPPAAADASPVSGSVAVGVEALASLLDRFLATRPTPCRITRPARAAVHPFPRGSTVASRGEASPTW